MNPSPCPDSCTLQAFALGDQSDLEADKVSEHLKECLLCNTALDAMQINGDPLVATICQAIPDDPVLNEGALADWMTTVVRSVADDTDRAPVLTRDDSNSRAETGSRDECLLDRTEDFGSYRLLSKLGQGGMGAVYKALHVKLDKLTAIKVLSPGRLQDAGAVKRFEQEMKAIGRVEHPNVVVAHDAGHIEGRHFLVMEYVDGVDVAELSRMCGDNHGRLPVAIACEIVRQTAVGLQHAHQQGIIHRDIKPGNLMLTHDGVVKVLDLGLARMNSVDKEDSWPGKASRAELTSPGAAMGTVGYMAPEQTLDSRQVDERTDVYSLGVTLYRLLCGRFPFSMDEYDSVGKMLVAISTKDPKSIKRVRPDLPREVVTLVDSMLMRKPDQRIANAGQVAQRLASFADTPISGIAKGDNSHASLAEPSRSAPVIVPSWTRPTRLKSALVCSAIALTLVPLMYFAGQFFRIQTEQGTLVVEIADDDVQARLNSVGIDVIDQKNERVWTITPQSNGEHLVPAGEYRFKAPSGLMVTDKNGLEIDSDEFKLVDADQRLRIRVTMENPGDVKTLHAESGTSQSSPGSGSPVADPDGPDSYSIDRVALKWVLSVGGTVRNPGFGAMTTENLDQPRFSYRTIGFVGARISNDDLHRISQLPQLRVLDLQNEKLDANCLKHIAANPTITKLSIAHTAIRLRDLKAMRDHDLLSGLTVSPEQLDGDWSVLKNFPRLTNISVTNPGLAPNADSIDLSGIGQHPQLRLVQFENTLTVSEQQIATAQSQNPDLAFKQRVKGRWKLIGAGQAKLVRSVRALTQKGWTVNAHGLNRESWSKDDKDAWDENQSLIVRTVACPADYEMAEEDKDLLAGIQIVDMLRLSGASNVQFNRDMVKSYQPYQCNLEFTDVTDADLKELAACCFWKSVALGGTNITREGLNQFRKAQPTCVITSSPFGPMPPRNEFPESQPRSITQGSDG